MKNLTHKELTALIEAESLLEQAYRLQNKVQILLSELYDVTDMDNNKFHSIYILGSQVKTYKQQCEIKKLINEHKLHETTK